VTDETPEDEIQKTRQAVTMFTNRFFVTVSADLTRIAFGEAVVGTEANYRSAIIMRTSDAITLADTLKDAIIRHAQVANQEIGGTLTATAEVRDGKRD